MVAGTSNCNVKSDSDSFWRHLRICFRASLIAARAAQWTDAARSNGGSPEAAQRHLISFKFQYIMYHLYELLAEKSKAQQENVY